MISCIHLCSQDHSRLPHPPSILLDNEAIERSGLISLGVPYMFTGLWVIQFTPLLTGVATVSAVLRVLWREDDSRVSVVL